MIKEELDPDLPLPAGNPVDEVLPGLYIGDFGASKDVDLLKRLNIKHILTVALESLPDTVLKALPDLNCLHIQTSDLPTTDIMTSFEQSNKFIDDGLQTGDAVLVHCVHGKFICSARLVMHAWLVFRLGSPSKKSTLQTVSNKLSIITL